MGWSQRCWSNVETGVASNGRWKRIITLLGWSRKQSERCNDEVKAAVEKKGYVLRERWYCKVKCVGICNEEKRNIKSWISEDSVLQRSEPLVRFDKSIHGKPTFSYASETLFTRIQPLHLCTGVPVYTDVWKSFPCTAFSGSLPPAPSIYIYYVFANYLDLTYSQLPWHPLLYIVVHVAPSEFVGPVFLSNNGFLAFSFLPSWGFPTFSCDRIISFL